MRIEELVSDWELEEIRQELTSGDAPDVVAFRHGIRDTVVREYRRRHGIASYDGYERHFDNVWNDAEIAFVRDNYPNHGRKWSGWKLMDRTWDAIRWYAHRLGVKRKRNYAGKSWRKSNETLLRYRKG